MPDDKVTREQIINDTGDIIVTAGAGSGKTTMLISKIEEDLKKKKSHYGIAAITFTNKAAKEIASRLGSLTRENYIGTNDGFVEFEIIRPFLRDALGPEFNENFTVEYFDFKFNSFNEGLKQLKYNNVLGTYRDNTINFKFQLALYILKKSLAARQFIRSKYFKLYVDEYQDCDKDMNVFFMYLKDELQIKLFIVGDLKQSIYIWRGADPQFFKNLVDNQNDFKKYNLTSNFRCCQDIQNYSNMFNSDTQRLIVETSEVKDVIGVKGSNSISDIIFELTTHKKELDLEKDIAILVRRRNQAIDILNELSDIGLNFTFIPGTPLDRATPNSTILKELAKFAKNERYTVYDLLEELPEEFSSKEIRDIQQLINPLFGEVLEAEEILEILTNLFYKLDLSLDVREIDAFTQVIMSTEYDIAFDINEYPHRIMTVHSAKGLEFDQVIITASDYKVYQGRDINEHYVATTRPRDRLVILLDDSYYLNHVRELKDLVNIKEIIKILNL